MDEDVLAGAVVEADEAEALVGIVPLDRAGSLFLGTAGSTAALALGRGTGACRCGVAGAGRNREHLGDLHALLALVDPDREAGAFGHAVGAGAGRLEGPHVQECLGAVGSLHEAEALGGVEPHHFGVGRQRSAGPASGRRALEVARLGIPLRRQGAVIIESAAARVAVVSVFTHGGLSLDMFGLRNM